MIKIKLRIVYIYIFSHTKIRKYIKIYSGPEILGYYLFIEFSFKLFALSCHIIQLHAIHLDKVQPD